MKQLLYATVTALILSIILTLLVPRWLFKGDARWTYRNDAASVDVKFNGHLKNGHVGAEGADLRITQPAWLSDGGNQGTMIEIPVSYRNKTCRVKLTPKADELGEDASLIIELKGRDFQHRGKRRPAWVCFRNITLNGQFVAGEKVVWHDKPFVLEYPLHSSSECTLTFDLCKPLAASDISIKNILGVFLACLVLCLFFVSPKLAECRIPEFIYRKDIVSVLSDSYHRIDPVYRRSFWIIFGGLCFAFGFHAICFMWGNHDWPLLWHSQRWLSHAPTGRYMVSSVKVLFLKGVYLPLIYDFIVFITLAINAVLLCRYWCPEKRVIYFVLCGLILAAQPFTLSMLYYINVVPEVFIGVTCVLIALILSENIATGEGHLIKKFAYSLIAIILVNFSLAMYPILINTIAVVFVGRLLVQSFDWDGSWQKLRSYLKPFTISAVNIMLGIVSYKLAITYVFPTVSFYNTDTLPPDQLPERIVVLIKQCFHQLYEYNMPFLPQWILWIFLGFTLILALSICFTGNIKQKVVRLVLLFASLLATQTAMIVAKKHLIDGRVELFGLVFFEVLVMAMVFARFRKLHNLWIITGACVVFASIVNDLDCLRVWKLGFDAEKMLWNRILARLEIQPAFDPNRKYQIVQIGYPVSMRKRYYTGQNMKMHDSGSNLLNFSYDTYWKLFRAPEFYYPTRFRDIKRGEPDVGKPDYAQLKRLYQAGVLQKAEVWPKPNGLIVWKNIILFVTDGKALDNYKKRFERELGKK